MSSTGSTAAEAGEQPRPRASSAARRLRLPLLGRDLAIDLGTATTLIYLQGKGVVVEEPSIVAVDAESGRLVAAGTAAQEMIGRTPARTLIVRPLADGVISDADITEQMLRWFLDQVRPSRLLRPRMVVCVPSGVTAVERRALEDAAMRSGARRVYVIDEAMAAAIGADLPIEESRASLVVDVGGGTTDVAVISLGGIVNARSLRVGGDTVDEAIVRGLRADYDVLVGERTGHDVKVAAGSAFPLADELTTRVRGRDLETGLPRTVEVDSTRVRRMIEEPVARIVAVVRSVLDVCPPELAGDVLDTGVVLTGGGAQLRGLDARLRHELGVPVRLAEDPVRSVVHGAGRCVEDFAALDRILVTPPRW